MTQQHEKAFFYDEAVRLAEKHGGTVEIPKHGLPDIVIYASGLAALIAEVRRNEREKCAQDCDREAKRWQGEQDIVDFRLCAAVIRARMEEGK